MCGGGGRSSRNREAEEAAHDQGEVRHERRVREHGPCGAVGVRGGRGKEEQRGAAMSGGGLRDIYRTPRHVGDRLFARRSASQTNDFAD